MAQLLGLNLEQVARIRPLFPKERVGKRVDGQEGVEPPDAPEPEVLMIDATDIKAHPTASSLNEESAPA